VAGARAGSHEIVGRPAFAGEGEVGRSWREGRVL